MRRRSFLKAMAASPLLALLRPREAPAMPESSLLVFDQDRPGGTLYAGAHQKDDTPCCFDTQSGPCMNARHWPNPLRLWGQRPAAEEAQERVFGKRRRYWPRSAGKV